ncbi:MAG: hypothetical protein ACFFAJ_17335, partial [Candidatus Hodarchaeota archaeon]
MTTVFIGILNVFYPIAIGFLFSLEYIAILALILSWTQILSIPVSNGIAPASLQHIASKNKVERDIVQSSSVYLAVSWIILFTFIFPLTFHQFHRLSSINLSLIISNTAISSFHVLFRMMLQGKELFQTVAVFEGISLGITISCFSILYLMYLSNLFFDISVFLLIPVLLNHVSFVFLALKNLGLSIFNYKTISRIWSYKLLKFAFFVGSGSIVSIGLSNLQIIIANQISDLVTLGIFSFWNYITLPFEIIAIALGSLLLARVSNLSKSSKDDAMNFVVSLNKGFSELIIPLSLILIFFMFYFSFVFDVLTFDRYLAYYYWPIILMFFLRVLINIMIIPASTFITAFKVKFNSIIAILMFITTVLTWIFFVKILDLFVLPLGILNAFIAVMLFGQFVLSYYNRRWSGINIHFLIFILFTFIIGFFIAESFNPIIGFIFLLL